MLIDARPSPDGTLQWTVDFGRLDLGDNHVQLDDQEFLADIEETGPRPEDWPWNYFDKVVPWSADATGTD
jgi:hypothetical protein